MATAVLSQTVVKKTLRSSSVSTHRTGHRALLCSSHLDVLHIFLERLKARWTSAIYGFYKPDVSISETGGRRAHVFACAKPSCKHTVKRYVDTKDRSTSNMKKHALACWGEEVLNRGIETGSAEEVRKVVSTDGLDSGRISMHFKRKKKQGTVTYSHMQHTREETRYVDKHFGFSSAEQT